MIQELIPYEDHIAENGATVFPHACKLGSEGIVSKRSMHRRHGSRCGIRRAADRIGLDDGALSSALCETSPATKRRSALAVRQAAVRREHVRDQLRARNHETMSPIIAIADAVPPDPLTDTFLGSPDRVGGLLRCKPATIKRIRLGVKRACALPQLGGKGGAGLKGLVLNIGWQLEN
jgi:hypothetical protein